MSFLTAIKLSIPEDAKATITVTASIKELLILREQLRACPLYGHYPIQTFAREVTTAIDWAEKHFVAQERDGSES